MCVYSMPPTQFPPTCYERLAALSADALKRLQGQKIAIRVLSQFGEETTKVLEVKQ